ncbi:MAG: phosphoribosyltransferase family protein, partial [Sphingomonadaceae bacterium]
LVDDLLATGGTALAGAALLRSVGAELVGAAFIVDLPDLEGARRLRADGLQVDALIEFPGH